MSDTFQVGDKEYSLEELQKKIEKGDYAIEMEQKYNTPFENAWSAYGKTQNENRELREKLEAFEKQTPATPVTPDLDEVFNQKGVVTKDQFDTMLDERLSSREQVKEIASKFKNLEGDIDGKDGRPKFDTQEVLKFMQENNLLDPDRAYNLLHQDEIANWKVEQLTKKPGFAPTNSGESASNKSPTQVSLNRDNLGAALTEALNASGGRI
jgi:hypothetical protein